MVVMAVGIVMVIAVRIMVIGCMLIVVLAR
jgi:hypothetical protein